MILYVLFEWNCLKNYMRGAIMKSSNFYLLIFLFVLSILLSCAPYGAQNQPVQKSNLTAGTVKKEIIKNKTTQAEIIQLFGSPNLMTMDSDGNEVWNYNRMSYSTTTSSDDVLILWGWGGSRSMRSSTTQSFDLIIVFDKRNVVRDYRVISAAY